MSAAAKISAEAASKAVVSSFAKATVERAQELGSNYNAIVNSVREACMKYNRDESSVRVLPVSKFKPASDILALYETHSLRHFGENYIQEFIDKAAILPQDIQWHFIGAVQSNKIKDLATRVQNLYMVESLSETKKLKKFNDYRDPSWPKTNVLLQINTSGEEQKAGLLYNDVDKIFDTIAFIQEKCDRLVFKGLMTIGSVEQSTKTLGENEDFRKLVALKSQILEKFSAISYHLDLSMGMSNDYEEAIRQGSDQIRIGTNIFGARDYSKH